VDWYPKDVPAYRLDTRHLSTLEHGAYNLLIDEYMLTREPLPDDDRVLASIARMPVEEWNRIAPTIRAFFRARAGMLTLKRCDAILNAQDNSNKRLSERAKKAADKRWAAAKALDATSMGQAQTSNAKPMLGDARERERVRTREESKKEVKPNGAHAPGPPVPDPCMVAVEAWNALASDLGLSVVQRLTDPRKRSLRARLGECGGIDGWHAALARVRASPFLLGQTGKAWKVSFDFLLQQSSFTKLMEGVYDRVKGTDGGGLTGWGAVAAELADEHRR